ncbi:hypothetical protein [Leifsonia soli]|uniref:Uncharacterized protein n=1 Tax=Leifsonia soli TaxID=582665 RepID=A0A852T5H5_9MICO|nr:hypothetical protein [Leifsonia soli]NYD76102.1 hypothetical protein [Leifsonia soli]
MTDDVPQTAQPSRRLRSAPNLVVIAFWLYVVAAALSLVIVIVSLLTPGLAEDPEVANQVGGASLLIAFALVSGILYTAGYLVVAVYLTRGANWARYVLLGVTLLSMIGAFSSHGLGAARVAAGAVATTLVFVPPANRYFSRRPLH